MGVSVRGGEGEWESRELSEAGRGVSSFTEATRDGLAKEKDDVPIDHLQGPPSCAPSPPLSAGVVVQEAPGVGSADDAALQDLMSSAEAVAARFRQSLQQLLLPVPHRQLQEGGGALPLTSASTPPGTSMVGAAATAPASEVIANLAKVVRNIAQHPADMRYRRLRKANAAVRRRLLDHPAAVQFLRDVGFVDRQIDGEEEGVLEMVAVDPARLYIAQELLSQHS